MMKDDDGDEEDDSVYFRDGVRRIGMQRTLLTFVCLPLDTYMY